MNDPERLIVQALKELEADPRGPAAAARATAFACIAQAMLLREFLAHVPVIDMSEFDDDSDEDKSPPSGPEW